MFVVPVSVSYSDIINLMRLTQLQIWVSLKDSNLNLIVPAHQYGKPF